MEWDGKKFREANLFEAAEFMSTRKVVAKDHEHWDIGFVVFDDGSWVGCESKWSGPYSSETPDVDGEPPVFYIYEAKR